MDESDESDFFSYQVLASGRVHAVRAVRLALGVVEQLADDHGALEARIVADRLARHAADARGREKERGWEARTNPKQANQMTSQRVWYSQEFTKNTRANQRQK
jgi:hypothetical protein